MKIAHFSPVPPDRTGIADYCLELLPELARHAEVDLWVEQGRVASPPEGCGLVAWGEPPRFTERLSPYDATVYHFGNSKYHRGLYRAFLEYPGTVVMHDFVLHHFFAECFLESAPKNISKKCATTIARWVKLWHRIFWRAGWRRYGKLNRCSFL